MSAANLPSRQVHVAIIGAGIAGLTCAKRLEEHGFNVTIFEKSRGVGGRMSTRRTPQHQHFDHGAQYFTVRDETFDCFVRTWLRDDVVAPWKGRIVELSRGEVKSKEDTTARYVGVPGMNAICRHLAADLDVRLQTRVVPPVREAGRWRLRNQEGTELGEFDCVICSAPAAQTAELLSEAPELRQTAERVVMHGCWAAMLSFDRSLNLPLDGAFVQASPLSWIACNSSKPGREHDTETWVLHASPEWSMACINDQPDDVLPQLIKAFWQATGLQRVEPSFATCHRWRYAIPSEPLENRCLFDAKQMLGACGDWCGGPRVEGAFLSGTALADQILSELSSG